MRQTGDPSPIFAAQANATSYTCTGLQADTAYYFFITAVNTAGESALSDPASARTLLAAPGVPSGVTAVAATTSSITVSWTAVQGAASYKLYYAIGSDSAEKVQVGEGVAAGTYTHTGLQANAQYYYYVVAVNAIGESAYSVTTEQSHTAPLLAPPSAPLGVTATALTPTSIRVTWSAAHAATSYRVYVAEGASSAEKIFVTEIADTSYTQGELFPGRAYYYYVQAVNAAGEGGYSAYTTASFARTPLAAPVDVTAVAATTSSITITWTAATGAASYRVYWAATSGGTKTQVSGEINGTAYTHTQVLKNTTYYYFVKAVSAAGESDYSANTPQSYAAPLLAAPDAPLGVTAQAVSTTSISVTWTAVPGAASYKVYWAGSAMGEKTQVGGEISGTAYTHSPVLKNTTYYYFVKAVNTAGESDYSTLTAGASAAPLLAVPDAPTGVTAQAVSTTSIRVTWTAATGAASYRVYWAATSGGTKTQVSGEINGTAYTHTSVPKNTTYYYFVKAVSAAGESDYSTWIAGVPLLAVPDAPTGATAQAVSTTSISVTWTAVSGAVSYKVYWAGSAMGEKTQVGGEISGTAYTHSPVLKNTTYYYFVKAVNTVGESDYSTLTAGASAAPLLAAPDAPLDVTAQTISTTSIRVTWTAVPDAASYKVYWAASPDGTKTQVGGEINDTAYTHTSVPKNTTCYYFVKAVNAAGESDYSTYTAGASTVPLLAAPDAPLDVTAIAATTSSITITWTAAPGAASYRVYWAATSGGTKTQMGGAITGTTYTHTGAEKNTTCYYFVKAVNAAGESAYSTWVAAAPLLAVPDAPTGVTAQAVSTTSIRVTWTAATGAASYRVYWAATSGGAKTQIGGVISGTSYEHTGAAKNTTYYYFVKAVNAAGESDYSTLTAGASAAPLLAAPGAPAGVTAQAVSTTSISVTWTAVSDAASYKVYWAATSGGAKTQIGGVISGTSYEHTGAAKNTTYYYFVKAVNAAGESDYSTWIAGVPLLAVPAAPTGVTAQTASTTSIRVTWTAVPGAASYKLYWAASPGGTKTQAGGAITDTTYTHTGLTVNTVYYYCIVAVNSEGESGYSAEASASTVGPDAPVYVQAAAYGSYGATITWNAVSGATGYKVYYARSESFSASPADLDKIAFTENPISNTTYEWGGFSSGASGAYYYWFYVTAVNTYSEGDFSAPSTPGMYREILPTYPWAALTSREMVPIAAGSFTMGSPATEPNRESNETQHTVTLTKGFLMGKYEVTQELYQAVMGSNPSSFKTGVASGEVQARCPVEQVSWYDTIVFCNKMSIEEGLTPVYNIGGSTDPSVWGTVPTSNNSSWNSVTANWNANGYRLPTEAEWEYACRAGTTTVYNLGNTWSGNWGWYADSGGYFSFGTHEVGKKTPNAWGLYDMHGNVWEWVWDWYGMLGTSAVSNPTGPSTGSNRVLRGGNWDSVARYLRSAYRGSNYPDDRGDPWDMYISLGFRVVRASP
jgi:formylglycine-generating enzyme required for sulfatase activity